MMLAIAKSEGAKIINIMDERNNFCELSELTQELLNLARDPRKGLPEEIFRMVSALTPMVNVDLLIRNREGRILLVWREDEWCGCGWHIPGGIVRFQETREQRIQKTAVNELHTRVRFEKEPVSVHEIIIPQTVRGHFISFLYRCYLPEDYTEGQNAEEVNGVYKPGMMCWHKLCPNQWVRGQREVYAALFEYGEDQHTSFFSENNSLSEVAEEVGKGNCTFTFDIDGVIANVDPALRYDKELPNYRTIAVINRLYQLGNHIILFTARGYKTGIDWSETTEKQMKEWGVLYHELKFGKPASSFYIDDKNMDLHELYRLAVLLDNGGAASVGGTRNES